MKVIATQEGVVLKPSDTELGILLKFSHPTEHTTRQVLEAVADIYSANFEEDVKSAIDALDEAALDKEAGSVQP